MNRPTLLPHLRPLWRDRTTLQLGTDPARALVLEFTDPIAARLLDLLDGARTETAIVDAARRIGIPAPLAREMIRTLSDVGALIDSHALLPRGLPEASRRRLLGEAAALAAVPTTRAPDAAHRRDRRPPQPPAAVLRRRSAAHVVVAAPETDLLVTAVTEALTAAGVGRVTFAGADPAPERRGPSLLLRVGAERRPAAVAARAYARRRVAHLTITVRDGVAVLGPLVAPGGTPCLRCLALHRSDRDPAWPTLEAQLATAASVPTCAATTSLAAAAGAAGEILAYLDGRPLRTGGATIEITGPGQERRRSWPPHPRCDCRRHRRLAGSGKN